MAGKPLLIPVRSKFIILAGVIGAVMILTACAQAQNGDQAVVTMAGASATPTRPAWCKPLPTEPPIREPATATPNILTPWPTPEEPIPTWTPQPTPFTIDLAPYLPDEDKTGVYVYRCNGQEDLVWVDPKDNPYEVIPLGAGDVILLIFPPASLMGHQPPTAAASPTSPPSTPNSNPYPFGTPIPIPYPIYSTPSPNPYP